MTQYNRLNVELSNSQLNKIKSAIKNETEVVLRLSSNMIGDKENNFCNNLLLTNKQVLNLCKDLKLTKIQLSKIIQSGGFFGRFLGPLLKTGLPLIKNVIKPLAKIVLVPLGLSEAASSADAGIHKKFLGSGNHPLSTPQIKSNNEIEDIVKIVKFFEDSGLLLKGVIETVQNEVK